MTEDDHFTTVDALVRTAGLTVPAEEVERLAALYGPLRRRVDRFHAVDVGDELPAAVLRADEQEAGA